MVPLAGQHHYSKYINYSQLPRVPLVLSPLRLILQHGILSQTPF